MNQMVATNVKQLVLTQGTFGPQEIHQITEALTEDSQNHRALREAVNEMEASEDRSPAAAVRLGVCQYILGRYNQAYDTLKTGDGGALAHFYLGKTYVALEEYEPALQSYTAAAKAGYDADIAPWLASMCSAFPAIRRPLWTCSIRCTAQSSKRPNTFINEPRPSPLCTAAPPK